MHKTFLIIGVVLAGLSVGLGAFGAHGLKKIVSPEQVGIYQTGVQYQMFHALALLFLGLLLTRFQGGYFTYAGVLFVAGIVLFSGSLYLIVSLQAMSKDVPTPVGILTPVGGLLFIAGWICLLMGIIRNT